MLLEYDMFIVLHSNTVSCKYLLKMIGYRILFFTKLKEAIKNIHFDIFKIVSLSLLVRGTMDAQE